jgi:anti-sigma regulatory factor (Ser/Thr protein kinase)
VNSYILEQKISNRDDYDTMSAFIETEINRLYVKGTEQNFFTKVAVYEAFNNSFQYGMFPISLIFTRLRSRLVIRIKDNGRGFPIADKLKLINDRGTQQLLEDLGCSVSGRGIFMMVEIADKVIFNKIGNELLLVMQIDKP